MKRSTVLPLLAASAAALFAGCEWTHSSGESSWSGSYDNMNFAGTYRISALNQTSDGGSGSTGATWTTTSEGGGTFAAGKKTASGKTAHNNVVPGSVKIAAGGYVWTDDGSGHLVFNGGSAGETTETEVEYPGPDVTCGTTVSGQRNYTGKIADNLVPGTVSITIGNVVFQDGGNNVLTSAYGSGSVNYDNGSFQIQFNSPPPSNQTIIARYKYKTTVVESTEGVAGSGTVSYTSGAWSLVLSKGMSSASSISVTYSYYSSTTGVDASTFDATKVTAITVSQTGQNLTLALNNGVTMAGRFTSVHKSTSSNVDLYNAQFQVSGSGNKLVGTLSYDQANMVKVLNGTWTSGSKTFDVSATGPSWSAN